MRIERMFKRIGCFCSSVVYDILDSLKELDFADWFVFIFTVFLVVSCIVSICI